MLQTDGEMLFSNYSTSLINYVAIADPMLVPVFMTYKLTWLLTYPGEPTLKFKGFQTRQSVKGSPKLWLATTPTISPGSTIELL